MAAFPLIDQSNPNKLDSSQVELEFRLSINKEYVNILSQQWGTFVDHNGEPIQIPNISIAKHMCEVKSLSYDVPQESLCDFLKASNMEENTNNIALEIKIELITRKAIV